MTAQFFVAAFEAHHGLDLDQGIKKSLCLQASSGAGGGNRTRDSCLEGKGITTMQRPQIGQGWIRTSVALSRARFTVWCH